MADDDEEVRCRVSYIADDMGPEEETNWIKRAGTAKVTYPNGHTFEGSFDVEKIKQGYGTYLWMERTSEDDDTLMEAARFEGMYKDGSKTGFGKMIYPSGDIYEGEWFENQMQGDGTYTYKKTGDIYFGSWYAGKKHGAGKYQFGANSSMEGDWENGQILTGTWSLANAAVYTGDFKLGRPYGAGSFNFVQSGLTQKGSYVDNKPAAGDEEEEEPAEGESPRPPNVEWKGQSLVAF